ncbi:MAG: SLBB domain-containing protein [Synergistales bacterium]
MNARRIALKTLIVFILLFSFALPAPAQGEGDAGGSGLPGGSAAGDTGLPGIYDTSPPVIVVPGATQGPETPSGPPQIFPGQPVQPQQPAAPGQEDEQKKGTEQGEAAVGPSELDRFLSGALPDRFQANIGRYGMNFFKNPPSTFAPGNAIPVGPDYVIGPGDSFRIDVWGMVQGTWTVTVDRSGQVAIPTVGTLGVAGLTFDQLKGALRRELEKYYAGFEMNVTMGALRSIKVYVTGSAKKPGAYTVSALSTLVNALLSCGGPGDTGTLRAIQVKRGGKTVAVFDMYDFLMKGDKTKDIRLQPEDVIHIGRSGPLAAITGNVRVPAIYELKTETRISELLEMAGGLTHTGYMGRVQVYRVSANEYRSILEGDLMDLSTKPGKDFALADGDFVRVFSVVEKRNVMTVSGPVAKPGPYGVEPGRTTVRDVIMRAGGLLYNAADQGEITRVRPTPQGPVTERFIVDLRKALSGDSAANMALEINDYLFVRSVPEWDLYKAVAIAGQVRYPGTYTIKKGETLSSVIARAGGYTDRAYLRGAEFSRVSVKKLQAEQNRRMVDELETELLAVSVNELSAALTSEEAKLTQFEADQKRKLVEKLKNLKAAGRVILKLDVPDKMKNSPFDLELEEGDTLFVPGNPHTVQVMGAVLNPTAFVFQPGLGVGDYLRMAGGYTRSASPGRIYLLKVDGTAVRLDTGGGWPFGRPNNGRGLVVRALEPGDAIIVPQKVQSYKGLRNTRDWVDIIFKIALSAASIHNVTD